MIFRNTQHDLAPADLELPLTLRTSPERVAGADRTHRKVAINFLTSFVVLAAVFGAAGAYLVSRGRVPGWGIGLVAALFIGMGLLIARHTRRTEERARAFLSADGETILRLDHAGLRVGDAVIPHARITCIFGAVLDEQFTHGGGARAGSRFAAQQRRRLYAEGAAHTVTLIIGVDHFSELGLPASIASARAGAGTDAGEICVPFDSYLERDAITPFLAVAHRVAAGRYPVGAVAGVLNTASARTAVEGSRAHIWSQSEEFMITV